MFSVLVYFVELEFSKAEARASIWQ